MPVYQAYFSISENPRRSSKIKFSGVELQGYLKNDTLLCPPTYNPTKFPPMPLYMDFHKFPKITIAEAKKAHIADEEIQKKYGVKYLQFWVNEEAGNLFCLVEGPDELTCESVHQMAHGHIACAMVEVDPNYYSLIMGNNIKLDQGLVRDKKGAVDLGYRNIMAITLQGKPSSKSTNYDSLTSPRMAYKAVLKEISKFKGRPIKLLGDDFIVSVFDAPENALRCAHELQSLLKQNKKLKGEDRLASFSIGLASGQPVTENNEFIEVTVRLAKHLSLMAGEDSIYLSTLIQELCEENLASSKKSKQLRSLSASEEAFMINLFEILDTDLSDEDFNIESLVKKIGISRPQLYRKIQSLTGKAPNDLIRDLRLRKALSLLKRKSGNISEIAFEVGFSNPSYFSKCFAEKFGCLPSSLS